jgi:two-component system response regulator MprA
MRILVADDDPSLRELLSLQLGLEGHEVQLACDGAQALEAIEREAPDLVVMDVMMPVLTGWEALRQLRADERSRRLPVVLLSGRDVQDDRRHGYELGASVVLSKPHELEALLGAVTVLTTPQPSPTPTRS